MKKFIILETQEGGCDYTIGCGQNWVFVEAKSIYEAVNKYLTMDEYAEHDGEDYCRTLDGDSNPDSFSIYEIGECLLEGECMAIYHDKQQQIKNAKIAMVQAKTEEEERQLYYKLKQKFDN